MTGNYQAIRLTEASINQGTAKPRSYSCWFAMTASSPGAQRGIAIGSYSNGKELCSPNNSGWQAMAGGHSHDFSTGFTMGSGVWYHFVQNYFEDGTLELWIDGVKRYSGSTYQFDINNTTLSIGSPASTNYSNYYKGYVAAARLWNRTLTEAEIRALSKEFKPEYAVTASNLSFSLYQKSETYSISYSSIMTPVTFEIIEGELPSTITFNTSTGQFTGKGLTDADHVYNLKVKISAPNATPATVDVTIHTYMTARISLSNQTFNFISNKAEVKSIVYTADETLTFTIESGTLPTGMVKNGNSFRSSGTNTSAESQQVVVRATSTHNQTGVTATMTLNIQMNAIVCNNQTFNFIGNETQVSKNINYSGSLNAVSDAVFTLSGSLPSGMTFSNGTFTYDGTHVQQDQSSTVDVTISSSNGTSTSTTATMTLNIKSDTTQVDPIIDDGLTLFIPCENGYAAQVGTDLESIYTSTPLSTIDGDKHCIYFDGETVLANQDSSYFTIKTSAGTPHVTLCFWYKQEERLQDAYCAQLGANKGYTDQGVGLHSVSISNDVEKQIMFGHWESQITNTNNIWHFYAMQVYDNNNSTNIKFDTYVDGVKIAGEVRSYPILISPIVAFGASIETFSPLNIITQTAIKGWYTRIRLYDRILTSSEINDLYNENFVVSPLPTSGLIFHIPFQEDYNEVVNNITPTVTGSSYISIQAGQGMNFYKNDATSARQAYLTYPNSTSILNQGTGDFSVCFWLKKNTMNWGSGNQLIICNTQTGDWATGMSIYEDGYHTTIDMRLGGENNFFSSTNTFPDTDWHFWVILKNGDTMKWYCDGSLDNTQSGISSRSFTATSNLMIGNANNWGSSKGNMCLAAFRIYNRALDETEIGALYNEF